MSLPPSAPQTSLSEPGSPAFAMSSNCLLPPGQTMAIIMTSRRSMEYFHGMADLADYLDMTVSRAWLQKRPRGFSRLQM
jgi:hypothetical protein